MYVDGRGDWVLTAIVVMIIVALVGGLGWFTFHQMNRADAQQARAYKLERELQKAKAENEVQASVIKHWEHASEIAIRPAGIDPDPLTPDKLEAALNPCWDVTEQQIWKKVCDATNNQPKIRVVVDEP